MSELVQVSAELTAGNAGKMTVFNADFQEFKELITRQIYRDKKIRLNQKLALAITLIFKVILMLIKIKVIKWGKRLQAMLKAKPMRLSKK